MRKHLHRLIPALNLALLPALGLYLAGCSTGPEPVFQDYVAGEWSTPGAATTNAPSTDPGAVGQPDASFEQRMDNLSDVLDVGDAVVVTLSGIATDVVPPHEERIKDDGTINLYLLGSVKAKGRTAGELQRDLQTEYERYFKNPVVTINIAPRYYYVGGEVKRPGAQPYLGRTSVTKAIQAAGDFTDFAKKGNIQVIRTDGTRLTVNVKKALRDPSLDPPIYPGDKIHVPRRLW